MSRPIHATVEGEGPPVVLVHGQPGDGSDWSAVAELLQVDHRVVVPDRPGYGQTGGAALGLTDGARQVARLLHDLALGPSTIVGHSYGGVVALRLAEIAPELAHSLVLVASAGTRSALTWSDRVLGVPGVGEALAFAGMRGLGHLAAWARSGMAAQRLVELGGAVGLPPERLEAHAAAWRSGPMWRSFAAEQRSLLAETPLVEAGLGSIGVPVYVIAGRRDVVVRPRAAKELARLVPGARLVWLPGGHLLPWQCPAEVAAIVARAAAG
ncbi:MAG TPA: alpha/beta hydrolase [Acidimicrobiales bacterium]|nr:alpha/beta hydrolase [Acidimicrobiales bacterium]